MRCKVCGFRSRGSDHEKGKHHKKDRNVATGSKQMQRLILSQRLGQPTNVGDPGHPTAWSRYAPLLASRGFRRPTGA